MKKISKKELKTLELKKHSGRRPNKIMLELDELDIGEALSISMEEWTLNSHPSVVIWYTSMFKKQGKKFSTAMTKDEKSWIITRLQ